MEVLSDPVEARRYLLGMYQYWDNGLKDLIRLCDDDHVIHRPIYALPIPHVWENTPGLTIIGDAAHLMSPLQEKVSFLDNELCPPVCSRHTSIKDNLVFGECRKKGKQAPGYNNAMGVQLGNNDDDYEDDDKDGDHNDGDKN
ncbi:hypothetical protein BG003_009613 [Podila horticola]|nr:hypothetical protein BG003_009613 [Podila horticola]